MAPSGHRLAGHQLLELSPNRSFARSLLRVLVRAELRSRPDLVGVHGARPGSGRTDGEFWEYGGWFLKSRTCRVFDDRDRSTEAFVRLRDSKLALGELAPAHSVVALLRSGDGRYQLWTIAPRVETVREWLDRARGLGDFVGMTRALCAFARCLGVGISVAVDPGLSLDLNPANFAVQGARVRYIDDDVAQRNDAQGVEDAFLARFAEYPEAPDRVWQAYVDRFAAEVAAAGPLPRVDALGIPQRIRAASSLWRGTTKWAAEAADRIQRERGKRL